MPLTAIALVTTAAVVHAFWNLFAKRQVPTAAFFLASTGAAMVALSPYAVYHRSVLALIPGHIWLLIAFSGLFETVYYAALAGAYRSGDMSLAYPLARALPSLFLAVATTVLGLGKALTPMGIIGIVAVTAGCIVVPVRDMWAIRLADYANACCVLVLIAALGTAGYTLIDSETLRFLRGLPGSGLNTVELTILYLALTSTATVIGLSVFVALYPPERDRLARLLRNGLHNAVVTGLVIATGYLMVLVAMNQASNVSYISAFRQTSIPLGAALGIVVQKEPLYPAKVIGTAGIVAGLVLVALT